MTIRQKNLQAFYDQLADDDITRDELDGRRKLCTLCETCWTSRADSLYTFRVSFPVVVHALEQLQQDGDEKAGQLIPCRYFKIRIYYRVVAAEHILKSTVHLSTFLQVVKWDLVEAVKESEVVINQLTSERNDQTLWDSLFDMAVSIADQFEFLPTILRRPG